MQTELIMLTIHNESYNENISFHHNVQIQTTIYNSLTIQMMISLEIGINTN